jgi:hypothetical protein
LAERLQLLELPVPVLQLYYDGELPEHVPRVRAEPG